MIICRCQLYVLDTNPHSLSAHGGLEDVSKVQKYVMSDEDYNKREGTYRSHQQQMRKVQINGNGHSLNVLSKIVAGLRMHNFFPLHYAAAV